ncbi:MAG: branched-chain amino acid ABC transporter permease [Anaerolineaceae bacterium]|nr:branched-chain amino acid ABC transporter permease [Anaerolineaceae bacterium]
MNSHVILQQIVNGLSLGAIYALIAVGFAIIVNVLKFSNFAHGGVLGISAYAGYLAATQFNLSLIPVILVGMATGAVVAVLVEFVAFRWIRLQKGQLVYFFVTSVTMLMLLEQILVIRFGSFFDTYPYDLIAVKTLKIGDLIISVTYLISLAATIIAFAVLIYVLKKTKIGIAIRAASNDMIATSLMGINTNMVIIAAFIVSGMLGGLSGVLYGISTSLAPQIGQVVVKGFIASLLGGLGSLTGVAVAAVVLGVLEVFLIATIGSGLSPVVIFLLMITFLLVRPQGFAGVSFADKA